MAWVVFQSVGKVIECFGNVVLFVIQNAQVAIGVGNTLPSVDGFHVHFNCPLVSLLVEQQSLFKRTESDWKLDKKLTGAILESVSAEGKTITPA